MRRHLLGGARPSSTGPLHAVHECLLGCDVVLRGKARGYDGRKIDFSPKKNTGASCIGSALSALPPEAVPVSKLEPGAFSCLVADVRFGSKADIGASVKDVRFTPRSGHNAERTNL